MRHKLLLLGLIFVLPAAGTRAQEPQLLARVLSAMRRHDLADTTAKWFGDRQVTVVPGAAKGTPVEDGDAIAKHLGGRGHILAEGEQAFVCEGTRGTPSFVGCHPKRNGPVIVIDAVRRTQDSVIVDLTIRDARMTPSGHYESAFDGYSVLFRRLGNGLGPAVVVQRGHS